MTETWSGYKKQMVGETGMTEIDGLVQEIRNSSALAMELRLF